MHKEPGQIDDILNGHRRENQRSLELCSQQRSKLASKNRRILWRLGDCRQRLKNLWTETGNHPLQHFGCAAPTQSYLMIWSQLLRWLRDSPLYFY